MRKPIVIANWKMNKSLDDALDFAQEFKSKLPHGTIAHADVVVCPAMLHLAPLAGAKAFPSGVSLGAQDSHWQDKGAFTGCVSAAMLKEFRVHYAIIGHSERRRYFSESSAMLEGKLRSTMLSGLAPIFCVGEELAERESGQTMRRLEEQMSILNNLSGELTGDPSEFILAYEPIWAIGTGRNATAEQAQEVHFFLRGLLGKFWGQDRAQETRIVYGGSVSTENFASLAASGDIDGALVGATSLDPVKFLKLIEIALGRPVSPSPLQ